MNISDWLKDATKQLKDIGIDSARLDAELILAETLRKPRTYLHAHLDDDIDPRRIDIANARLDLRKDRVPIAYIIGYKDFYGRKFTVSPQVLIPRPESEDLVSLFLEIAAEDIQGDSTLIDIGSGSGCLGVTIKLERPDIAVILSDVSSKSLDIAHKNAEMLGANVRFQKQNLLLGQIEPIDYIVANLPYVSRNWQTSPETKHEPEGAIFAESDGLSLIFTLIEQAPLKLADRGWLLLEADPEQHQQIIEHASKNNFEHIKTFNYSLALRLILTEHEL